MTSPSRTSVSARRGSLGIAAVLTATSLSMLPGPAQAVGVDPLPLSSGSAWLRANLAGTSVPDSLEAALGLKVAGDPTTAAQVRDATAPAVGAYVAPGTDPEPDPTARAEWFAQQLGAAANTYGGANLLDDLAAMVGSDGRLTDTLGVGGGPTEPTPTQATTTGQIFGTTALLAGGPSYVTRATVAASYTATLQCAAGFFNAALPTTATLCDTSKPSVQTTARYVIAMRSVAGTESRRASAVDWLAKAQQPNGRWTTDGGQGSGDSTSTALAGYALAASGRAEPVKGAAIWLRGNQLANAGACPAFPAADVGAVALDGNTYVATAGNLDAFRRATSQALLVLAAAPGGPGVVDNTLSVPKFAKPGQRVTASVRTAPRNLICASAPTLAPARILGGYDSTADFTFTAAQSGPTTASITDPSGQVDTATVTTLAKKKLGLTYRSKRVRAGRNALIKVSRLEPGETVSVQFRGQRKARTVANSQGKAKLRFTVTGQRGFVKVKVTGQYNNRSRVKSLIVLR